VPERRADLRQALAAGGGANWSRRAHPGFLHAPGPWPPGPCASHAPRRWCPALAPPGSRLLQPADLLGLGLCTHVCLCLLKCPWRHLCALPRLDAAATRCAGQRIETSPLPFGALVAVPFGDAHAVPFGEARAVPFGEAHVVPLGEAHAVPFGEARAVPSGVARAIPPARSSKSSSRPWLAALTPAVNVARGPSTWHMGRHSLTQS
jgi:hypothetical protein